MTTNDRSITWDDILRRIKVGEDISFIDYIIKLGSKINAILSGATVNSEFKFINCSFECQISILDVKFNKNVTFRGCQFHEAMRFMGVTFENRADFARASFEQTADFGKSADGAIVTFKNETDFTNAEFARVADFSGCKFNGQLFGTRFIESKFNRGFRLLEVECGEKAEIFFDRAMLRQEPEIEGIKFAEDIEEARKEFKEGKTITGDVGDIMKAIREYKDEDSDQ